MVNIESVCIKFVNTCKGIYKGGTKILNKTCIFYLVDHSLCRQAVSDGHQYTLSLLKSKRNKLLYKLLQVKCMKVFKCLKKYLH